MKAERVADSAGVIGAIFAALCCAGTPFIVAGLAAVGLSFLRKDAILWPVMFASLAVALWGLWRGVHVHHRAGPFVVGLVAGTALALGVVVIHGSVARVAIAGGAIGLVLATVWNVAARARRAGPPAVARG